MAEAAKDDAADLARLCQYFEDAEEAFRDSNAKAERDRDYYDNKQLTAEEVTELEKRGQPPIIVNRIKRKIDFLRGVETQQRTDPKAFPRNPQDEQAAHAATDALRYVADVNSFDTVRSEVWENLLVEGLGGAEVTVEKRGDRYEVVITQMPWDRLFIDPHSRRPDCSDARYLGGVLWMDAEEAAERWPDSKEAVDGLLADSTASSFGEKSDDRPRSHWLDSKRKRVRIVQMYYKRGGQWHFATFTKGVELEGGVSPYLDEDGQPECPLIVQSAYVDRNNNRYGVVREMIGPQDEINKRRSKALHLLSVRQVIAEQGAVDDVGAARKELAKPDGFVEVNPTFRFEIQQTADMATGQWQLLQHATQELDGMGPNAAMAGKSAAEQSGRAIIAQQQGGYIELGPLMDRLRQWNIRIYRAIWNRVRQFWQEERWIRVTDDENSIRFVGLNVPQQDPETGQMVMYSPAQMMVDIVVDDAPDSVTIQHEQFQQVVELVKAGIPIPPDVLILASQLRNKEQLLEKLKPQAPDPMVQELQARHAQAEVAGLEARAMKDQAQAHKTMAEAGAAGMPQQADSAQVTMDRLEQAARIDHTAAQSEKLRADALGRVVEMSQPQPVIPPGV